jgi:Zn-finger nucleic acid-binding protein
MDFVSCENCGAPMTVVPGRDYFFCRYCGSYAFPQPSSDGVVALGEEGDVDCPVCCTTLVEASVSGVRVLHCAECRGILAGQEAFSTIVRFLRAQAAGEPDPVRPLNREDLQRETACPYCGHKMDTHPYYGPGNVVIDNCTRCAVIWLDYGELAIIRDAPGKDRQGAGVPGSRVLDWLFDDAVE